MVQNQIFQSLYGCLKEFGSSYNLAKAHLTHLKNILKPKTRGLHVEINASSLRDNARNLLAKITKLLLLKSKCLLKISNC